MKQFEKLKHSIALSGAAFGITAALLLLVFLCFGLFPFGDKTLAWGDMRQQVVPLLLEFKDILAGKSGIFWSLKNAGGMNFWGVFFFFLASPFHFLAAFVKKENIFELVNLLVVLKLALSAVSASLFFQKACRELDRPLHLTFCVSYALCGYGMLYYQNLVWLDLLLLFPLLMTGFFQLFSEQKSLLFTVTLSLALIVNYYLSYMVLLALVILSALFTVYLVPKEKRGETAGRIGISALLSLCTTAVVWLPSLLQCFRSARIGEGLLESLQTGSLTTELFTTLPVLFCTAFIVALPGLIPWFSMTPTRKALLLSVFLLLIPLIVEPVNKLWHTGSYQAFPVRYGYIPVFLALWYLADCVQEPQALSRPSRRYTWAFLGLASIAVLWGTVLLKTKFEVLSHYTRTLWFNKSSFLPLLLFSLVSALAVWTGVVLWRRGRLSRKVLSWTLLCLCLFQGGYHAAVLIGSAAYAPQKTKAVLGMEGTLADPGLYRVKQESKFCDVNLIGAAGFNTLNHYTSLTDEAFLHTVKKLGYSSYWMETSSCCGTEFSDLLLSNKYALSPELEWTGTGSGDLGYLLPAGILPEKLESPNRFSLQNDLYRRFMAALGQEPKENAFLPYFAENGTVSVENREGFWHLNPGNSGGRLFYEIETTDRETLYFDAFCENTNRLQEKINGAFQVAVNGTLIQENYPSQSCNGILRLGSFQNERVQVEITVKKEVQLRSFGVFGLKSRKIEELSKNMKNGALTAEKNGISGEIWAETADTALFLSVPSDPGLRVAVNGKEIEPRVVLDCFLEIPLEQGENRLEITYLPPGFKTGALFTGLGILTSLWFFGWRKGRAHAFWNRIAWPLLLAAFSAVLLLVYLGPTAIWIAGANAVSSVGI